MIHQDNTEAIKIDGWNGVKRKAVSQGLTQVVGEAETRKCICSEWDSLMSRASTAWDFGGSKMTHNVRNSNEEDLVSSPGL